MELIRVSNDHWNFEGQETGKRFVPFGCNFVFDYPIDGDKMRMTIWGSKQKRRMQDGI